MNSSKLLLGILGGVAVGAVAGILFAPDKGTETRKKILKNGQGYADDLKNKFKSFQNEVTDKYNGYLDEAKDMVAAKEKAVTNNLK